MAKNCGQADSYTGMALRRDIKAGRSFPENVDVVFKRLEIVCEYSQIIGNNSDLEKRKGNFISH